MLGSASRFLFADAVKRSTVEATAPVQTKE